jgi:hypothetical protein
MIMSDHPIRNIKPNTGKNTTLYLIDKLITTVLYCSLLAIILSLFLDVRNQNTLPIIYGIDK